MKNHFTLFGGFDIDYSFIDNIIVEHYNFINKSSSTTQSITKPKDKIPEKWSRKIPNLVI